MLSADFLKPLISAAVMPPVRMELAAWTEKHRELPAEQSASPGPWRNDKFPFLVEIMECLSPWHPCETVTFAKSAQVGGTEIGFNWMFYVADQYPGPMLIVHPTIQAAQAWVREKLSASIRQCRRIRHIIVEQKSRDGASTTLFKSFANGFWVITGANSSVDISSKSVRYVIKEEIDRWPDDVDGQGDPEKLVNERQTSFTRSGLAKTLSACTPKNAADSRIWAAYMKGDQRRFYVPCPHCGFEQVLHFFPNSKGRGGLVFEKQPPFRARYACADCGVLIEHFHKDQMLARGRWIAQNQGEAVQPSFHINALYSPVTTWDKIAEKFLDAKDDRNKLITFVNLVLGEPWEERGDAPEWVRLFERRSDYDLKTLPPGVVLLTCGVDVQKDGVYFETVGWGTSKRSWSVDCGFYPGDPSDPQDPVWDTLSKLMRETYPDAFGNRRSIDLLMIDSGYQANAVYAWSKKHAFTFAVKGMPGWLTPAVGTPTKQEINLEGKKQPGGVLLYPIGTWPLKAELYANLRKALNDTGDEQTPPGFCFFSRQHDETFFRQLTAEFLKDVKRGGRTRKEWFANGANHFHDCRIYAMAGFEYLRMVEQLDDERFELLRLMRETPPQQAQAELFTSPAQAALKDAARKAPDHDTSKPTADSDWIGDLDDWI
jgi:phage terminase large subunit GpA-like protein